MAVKVSQQRDHGVMTDNVKLISMILLSVSLFFSVLFFAVYNTYLVGSEIGTLQTNDLENADMFIYLVIVTTLSVAIIAMEFYHIKHRSLSMLKYAVIIGNGVLVGLAIHELSIGYVDMFVPTQPPNNAGPQATMYTYAALATGFAGIGTLLAVLHNFHGIIGAV